MYMEPIVRAPARAAASTTTRRLVGLPVLLLSALVMLPFLAAQAVYATLALTLRAAWRLPRTLVQMIDYAGTVALGR